MDRETRKANLKKLQLPNTSGCKQRKTRETAKSTLTTNAAISKYFLSPEKQNLNSGQEITNVVTKPSIDSSALNKNKLSLSPDVDLKTDSHTRAKRTKLDAFILKDPKNIPNSVSNKRNSLNDEDFLVPKTKIKKAPKISQTKTSKPSRAKKQPTIKSAFFRNEHLFAEIAAQHCAADQFDGDDVQLALAISKSESENKGIQKVDHNLHDGDNKLVNNENEAESIREKLKKYGFRTAEKEDYNTFTAAFLTKFSNRRAKTKWANKFTALTLRSSENQLKKLQENIDKLINSQFRTKPLSEEEKCLPRYKLQSTLLRKSAVADEKRIIQNGENVNRPNKFFFVTELFEINQVPAGHLLKDWDTIQGRDFTPKPKDKKYIEKSAILENIYHELQEYFSSRKRLNWTSTNDNNDDLEMSTNKEANQKQESLAVEKSRANSSEFVQKPECNEELDGMIELIESMERKEKYDNGVVDINCSNSPCDKRILQLLPTSKCLDAMQVSSCSVNTQATINTTQKNRSNSPDLFADSDVEMGEIDTVDDDRKKTEEKKTEKSDVDTGTTDITTYEIFSSDEVKNTPLLKLDKSPFKEQLSKTFVQTSVCDVVDLTQDDLQPFQNDTSTEHLNQSKPIMEVDLFAESPLHDTNSDASEHKGESFKFTLSLESNDREQQVIENEMKKSFKDSPRLQTSKLLENFNTYREDHDIILREMALDQHDKSFFTFEDSKQFETSLHKKTSTVENDIINYNLTVNDTIFRELCHKYLDHETASTSELQKNYHGERFSQILPTIQTPQNSDNLTNFTMDFDLTSEKNVTLKRKSMSFTAKTPLMKETSDSKINLSKSQSFNNLNANISIDLTQNSGDADDYVEFANVEDDDCLILSDDEINYSIWQANKTLNLQTFDQNDHLNCNKNVSDKLSNSDEEDSISPKDNIVEFPCKNDKEKEFSYLDLKEKESSLIKITLEPNESITDFEILTSKYALPNYQTQEELKIDRGEFGILEEYSQPIDDIPNLYTPTKVLAEASFLNSPSETTAPMRRYSNLHRSSQKFQDLLNNERLKSPSLDLGDFSDFDEFDRLADTNPFKTNKLSKRPQGIDQLLNAEISFKKTQEVPQTTKKLSSESSENTLQEVKYNNKTYTVRYVSSPKPDYTKYSEAELLKELYNYGIKPLKRKQALKMLEYIYNQTHPMIMESTNGTVEKQQDDVVILDDFERPCTSKEALKTQTLLAKKTCENFMNTQNNNAKETDAVATVIAGKNLNLQDSCGLEMLRYSLDLKAELPDENYILQTNVTKKTPQPLLPFHIAWYNLVCSNRKLHETILMYEPVDLQEIYLFLKTLGYRYDPKDLKLFFDRRCIIFRYDLTSAADSKTKNINRHVRKSKKSKANQT